MGAAEAVIEAGRLRLRPILMTTGDHRARAPAAGPRDRHGRRDPGGAGPGGDRRLLASTLVTLVLIPVAYTSVTGLAAKWLSEDTRAA
jgi:multidrug efflux pump subunit AcrB